MFKKNIQLKESLNKLPKSVDSLKVANSIPDTDTTNRQGFAAYSVEDELHFVSMLNTLKLENQFYRTDKEQMKEIQEYVEKLALKDPYFVAQCIVWSRCMGEGMRSINHVAAALLAPFISGKDFAKRFYGLFDKKNQKGGCIFRPDDMSEIKEIYDAISKSTLTNAMKKGFADVIENLDSYSLLKYKKTIRDIANLVHPKSANSKAECTSDGIKVKTIDAIMQNLKISADTWEVAQSEAGQIVAKAVKEGKLTEEKAKEVLKEAKNENWAALIEDNKLPILAALRNLNNILKGDNPEVVEAVCKLVSNEELLKKGKIMPYQIDLAYETVKSNEICSGFNQRLILGALEDGIEKSVSNLKEILTGRNLVIMDCSGSMGTRIHTSGKSYTSCSQKAALIAAMICKSTNADLIRFGSSAVYSRYSPRDSVFSIARTIQSDNMGCTNLAAAFDRITKENREYDRIFILSDNECNVGSNKTAYKKYVRNIGNPYIYSIDLAAYGTMPLKSDRVHYFFGYGYAMFDAIASDEFDASKALDKIRKVVI